MPPSHSSTQPAATLCMAQLFKTAFDGGDLKPLRAALAARVATAPADAGTCMSLCVVEQLLGDSAGGMQYQQRALRLQRLYQPAWPASRQALRVLALMAPGEVGANMPIEFLLENREVTLIALYLVPGEPLPMALPDHDVAIVAADISDANRGLLEQMDAAWTGHETRGPHPLLNHPGRLPRLRREHFFRVLGGIPGLFVPPTVRVPRAALERLANDAAAPVEAAWRGHEQSGPPLPAIEARPQATSGSDPAKSGEPQLAGMAMPLIARPVGSHAGRGLARLECAADAVDYLAAEPAEAFYVSPFVDYRGAGGAYRKYRIMMVDGRPYPCHMAVAPEWKLWYYNADMAASADKRAEEEAFLTGFEQGFGRRHEAALAAMAERIGLDYWGIDCAETPAGELLLFEGSTCLAAHALDSPQVFPYKRPAMQKLFNAFEAMLRRHGRAAAQVAAR